MASLLTNFKWITLNLIPHFLRQSKFVAYINASVQPLITKNNELELFKNRIDRQLAVNSSYIHVEKYLNDLFDTALVRIFISDTAQEGFFYYYTKDEVDPDLQYFYTKAETDPVPLYYFIKNETGSEFDFIVNVPFGVAYSDDRIRAIVNLYKPIGKNYKIERF